MFEKWYEIKGITPEMYEQWKDNMRTDVITYKKGNKVVVSMLLNPVEAYLVRKQIEQHNKNANYVLGLVRA